MNTTILSFTKPITTSPTQLLPTAQHRHLQPLLLSPIKHTRGITTNAASNDGGDASSPSVPPPPVTPSDTVEIRFKRGARRRARKQEDGVPKQAQASAPKDWEAMTLTEKAIELYVGEKGLLFWINKFAYASIFIVIGAWILFRFVGPALNLYQLDTPPLSPTSILK